jgi:DNA-binding transcriptional MerR regulator
MSDTEPRYSLSELADLAGVTPRTIRYYVSQGLLPSPGSVGRGVKYGDEHLDRLRLIRRLQRAHLPLGEIRRQLTGLDTEGIAELADAATTEDDARASEEPTDSALDYVRRLLAPQPIVSPALRRPAGSPLARAQLAEMAASSPAREPPSVPDRSQWERITLADDVELHVRRPLPRHTAKRVDRLVSIARELLEEEPS